MSAVDPKSIPSRKRYVGCVIPSNCQYRATGEHKPDFRTGVDPDASRKRTSCVHSHGRATSDRREYD
jgi:hypothetical protein